MASSGLLSFTEAVLMCCPLQENGIEPEEMCRSGLSLTGFLNVKSDINGLGSYYFGLNQHCKS